MAILKKERGLKMNYKILEKQTDFTSFMGEALIEALDNEWYTSGDILDIYEDGYIIDANEIRNYGDYEGKLFCKVEVL